MRIHWKFFAAAVFTFLVNISDVVAANPSSFAPLAKKALPAVVNISTTKMLNSDISSMGGGGRQEQMEELFRHLLGLPPGAGGQGASPKVKSLGSGFFISKDGYVVTNRHIVAGADEIIVKINSGKEYKAKIIGKDARTDVALLKVDAKENFQFLDLTTKDVEVGDWVLAIGNPFGLGTTVTAGIISSDSRDIASQAGDLPVANYVGDLIQTDAMINVGNSGGPMINMDGKVIGINFAIITSPGGGSGAFGFAVPSSHILRVVPQLKKDGKVTYGWLGVHVQEVTDEIAQSLNLGDKKGAMVVSVIDNSPGQKVGIEEGDVILKIGNKELDTYEKLPRYVAEVPVGNTANIELWRDGKLKKMSVKIEEMPDERSLESLGKAENTYVESKIEDHVLGMDLIPLQPHLRLNLGLPPSVDGMLVKGLKNKSQATEAGIRPGDVIIELEGDPVVNKELAKKSVNAAKVAKKKAVLAKIYRRGQSAFIGVPLEVKEEE